MKTSKFNPIRFEITGNSASSIHFAIKHLENFTSEAGCIKICSQKYYFSSFPSVEDMAILREREVDQGTERIFIDTKFFSSKNKNMLLCSDFILTVA